MTQDTQSESTNHERVDVLLPLPLDKTYTYLASPPWRLGDFVHVSLGRSRKSWGVIWGPGTPSCKPLKPLLDVHPGWYLPQQSRDFIQWVSAYTLTPRGLILKMVCPAPQAVALSPGDTLYLLNPAEKDSLTAAQRRMLDCIGPPDHLFRTKDFPSRKKNLVSQMIADGILSPYASQLRFPPIKATLQPSPHTLSCAQNKAAQDIIKHIAKSPGFSVTVLEGVTGSGKTAVYFEALDQALAQGKQILVLVPELALTVQWLERFQNRFGFQPLIWHGSLSPAKRQAAWAAIRKGSALVILGARSALFLPYCALGLIIVEEEHDGSYKQEEGVLYHARDMAIVRGNLGQVPVLLVSATPSLETLWNIRQHRYHHVTLHTRYRAEKPQVHLVDLRTHPPGRNGWISPALKAHIQNTLDHNQQTLLYLNRRGYAPFLLCQQCGEKPACHQCSAWLVFHEAPNMLRCHHCGYSRKKNNQCHHCHTQDSLIPCGPGVERLAQEAAIHFPRAHIQIMSRDTSSSPQRTQAVIEEMANKNIDILIGTQMVAKGHHFPGLTCVGVIDGDYGLGGCDLRAVEKTYQLLVQVAGRAGRGQETGHVWIQTFSPHNPLFQALLEGQPQSLIEEELSARQANGFPPFGRLAALIFSSRNAAAVKMAVYRLAQTIPTSTSAAVWGPIPAPIAQLRGHYRWRFLIKAEKKFPLQSFLRHWIKGLPQDVRCQIDIDPMTFL